LKIALDIDGTLANFSYTFCAVAWEAFGLMTRWKEIDCGLHIEQFKMVYDYMIRQNLFQHLKAYEGSAKVVQSWAKEHTVVYITRRRPGHDLSLKDLHHHQTRFWLKNQGFPDGDVVFEQDKLKWCLANKVDILVEDYLPDVLKVAPHIKTFLVNRPWNAGDYPHRVNNLAEVSLDQDH